MRKVGNYVREEIAMRRLIAFVTAAGMTVLGLVATTGPAQAKGSGPNGRIVFLRPAPAIGDTVPYTVNPDGSHVQLLFPGAVETFRATCRFRVSCSAR